MPLSLSAVTGSLPGTAVLSWVAPGDNGSGGYLLSGWFAVQASTWSGADFSTAAPGNLTISTAAIAAGSTQSYTISGLAMGTTYYFAAWAADDALNWSPVSSTASAVSGAANTGSISGTVTQASTQPIAGVIVEAYDANDFVRASDNTASDGTYELSGLDLGKYTVRATWSANDITSAVSKSDIDTGAGGVNFMLSIAYELATISGYIPAGFIPDSSYYARTAASARFRPSGEDDKTPYVELFQKGRRVAAAPVDSGGRFRISNLLPGTYSIRVFNGREFTDLTPIKLKEGENFNFVPEWSILSKEAVYAYPNPARTAVNIHFETNLASQSDFEAEVSVFNIAGGLVKTFRAADVSPDTVAGGAGSYKVAWNFSNEKVASGVYLYVVRLKYISTGKVEKVVKKLAIIR
ncbi:MAG: carboxypeptidase regulatory-like domain-containing protein [Elusimicrobia bacterium]|nr:carboxypeptidase regulatory-like domain-containing protein [Elusimicrobiota bacterium]